MPAFLRKIFFWEFMIMSLILFGSLNRCNVDQWEHSNKLKVKQTVCIVLTAEISTFWLDYCNGSWQRWFMTWHNRVCLSKLWNNFCLPNYLLLMCLTDESVTIWFLVTGKFLLLLQSAEILHCTKSWLLVYGPLLRSHSVSTQSCFLGFHMT